MGHGRTALNPVTNKVQPLESLCAERPATTTHFASGKRIISNNNKSSDKFRKALAHSNLSEMHLRHVRGGSVGEPDIELTSNQAYGAGNRFQNTQRFPVNEGKSM